MLALSELQTGTLTFGQPTLTTIQSLGEIAENAARSKFGDHTAEETGHPHGSGNRR